MECPECRKLLSRGIDGAIDEADVRRIDRHLESCTQCVRFRDTLRAAASIHRRIREIEPPPRLAPSIMAAVAIDRREAWPRGWLRIAVPAAATAAAVLGIWLGGLLTERFIAASSPREADPLELQYLDEYPPGSLGEVLMASAEGGGNERE
jgi:predicted anti-sigma-YlaC factor YlaD